LIPMGEASPEITMPELATRLIDKHGLETEPATLSPLLCRQGFT
jgi:hypothetical protein